MPHNRTVSSKDVAALAGVAQSTVSYVMSGKRSVSANTRAKVERAMQQLNYVPDAHARAMISNQSHIIGLVTETTENTQGDELFPLLHAIQNTAQTNGYDLILVSPNNDVADMRRLAMGNLVDAFLIMDIRRNDKRLIAARDLGIPIVPLGDPDAPGPFHCVTFDQKTIVEMAFQEMHNIGARIAVPIADARGGVKGFPFLDIYTNHARECAQRYGIQLEPFDAPNTYWQSIEPLSTLMKQWKGKGVCIYVRSPRTLAWIEHMMLLTGITPGKDIGLIGECSDHFAEIQPTPITNISPQSALLGIRATRVALAQIDGQQPSPQVEFIAPKFTRRATTIPGFAH